MSNVLIPLGGAGGKNRGSQYKIPENAQTLEMFGSIFFPLPPGVYKKLVLPNGQPALPSSDGGDAAITMTKEFLKKQAIKTFGIASITNFSLSMYAHRQVRLTWAKPDRGLFSGVHFVFKYGSMPTNENDGFMVYDSADVHYETARLDERELFIRAYSYVTVTDGRWYDEGKVSARITVTGISGSVTLGAGAGVWTVPDGVRSIRYILVGHGGQGGHQDGVASSSGGGGGYFTTGYMSVTPGQGINWVVPSKISYSNTHNGSPEVQSYKTVFGSASASYGRNGTWGAYDEDSPGGNGGSGGGGGYLNGAADGAPGGSNGSDGVHGTNGSRKYPNSYARGGVGQHTSTLGFNGVLYCGGGGGGRADGGAGGGGNGWQYNKSGLFQNGAAGIDGLGGGGGGGAYKNARGGNGGTGCIYVAWGNLMND